MLRNKTVFLLPLALLIDFFLLHHIAVFAWNEPYVCGNMVMTGTFPRIYRGQLSYYQHYGNFYPPPGVNCPSGICWQGERLSSLLVNGSSGYSLYLNLGSLVPLYCPHSSDISAYQSLPGGLQGDVRFRCRRQGTDVACFAYRCEQASPAGCKQKWRLRFKPKADGSSVKVDCFDVGENDGVCGDYNMIPTNWSCLP